jgi:hypothetical protein
MDILLNVVEREISPNSIDHEHPKLDNFDNVDTKQDEINESLDDILTKTLSHGLFKKLIFRNGRGSRSFMTWVQYTRRSINRKFIRCMKNGWISI